MAPFTVKACPARHATPCFISAFAVRTITISFLPHCRRQKPPKTQSAKPSTKAITNGGGVPESRLLHSPWPTVGESLRTAATHPAAAAPTGDQFLDQLDANFNKPIAKPPAKRRTENNSPTFGSSGDPCLDFFFHVVPGTLAASVTSLLVTAWAAELVTALSLACNLRGVRGTGKADSDGFYAAALCMHGCHPAMLALNASAIAEIGYLKDLPELFHRIVNGDGHIPRFHARKPCRKILREEALVLRRMRNAPKRMRNV